MKRGLRVILTTLLATGMSASYAFDEKRGLPMIWKLLLAERDLARALALLSCLTIIFGSLWYAGREIRRYFAWRAGKSDWQDVEREMAWIIRFKRFGTTKRAAAGAVAGCQSVYYELRLAYGRAKRRWPHKKGEVARVLARRWTRKEWQGVAIMLGGQALLLYFSVRTYFAALSPALGLCITGSGLLVGNLVAFMLWVAGDDDEGGHRQEPVQPEPTSGKGVQPVLRVRWKSGRHVSQQKLV